MSTAAMARRHAAAARDARRCIITAAATIALYIPIVAALITLTP